MRVGSHKLQMHTPLLSINMYSITFTNNKARCHMKVVLTTEKGKNAPIFGKTDILLTGYTCTSHTLLLPHITSHSYFSDVPGGSIKPGGLGLLCCCGRG